MRRLLLSFALAVSLSAVGASSALAQAPEGAQKAPLYGPHATTTGFGCATGVFPTPKTFGFVVLNTPGNENMVSAEVALKHAAPNTTYVLGIQQDPGTCPLPVPMGSITTNKKGNANGHFTAERAPTATKFWVAIESSVASTETYGSSSVELD